MNGQSWKCSQCGRVWGPFVRGCEPCASALHRQSTHLDDMDAAISNVHGRLEIAEQHLITLTARVQNLEGAPSTVRSETPPMPAGQAPTTDHYVAPEERVEPPHIVGSFDDGTPIAFFHEHDPMALIGLMELARKTSGPILAITCVHPSADPEGSAHWPTSVHEKVEVTDQAVRVGYFHALAAKFTWQADKAAEILDNMLKED